MAVNEGDIGCIARTVGSAGDVAVVVGIDDGGTVGAAATADHRTDVDAAA